MPNAAPSMPSDLIAQLISGPSLREVATGLLTAALQKLYPHLGIDPERAMVVTPVWESKDGEIVHGSPLLESLTDVLTRLARSVSSVTYLDGEHFLTLQPGSEPMLQLPVRIDVIGRQLNDLAALIYPVHQQRNLDYWNEQTSPDTPRWRLFSQTLRKLWNVSQMPGWDEDQCAMARALFNYPELAQRLPNDKYLSRAYLIDLDITHDGRTDHLMVLDRTVLVGALGDRALILSHSLQNGLQSFDSLDALGESLKIPDYLAQPDWVLQWRLLEPEGDFFDTLATTLISLENSHIGESEPLGRTDLSSRIEVAANGFNGEQTLQPANFTWVQNMLPPWLEQASTPDISRYSRHLLDLAEVRNQADGKTFCDDIPPIKAFALQALRKQMEADHTDAASVHLEDIVFKVTSLVVWGTFTVPGATETVALELTELALQNLIALPVGNKVLIETKGRPLPAWMTPAYVEQLVRSVDIGGAYPALIKSKLLDDPVQSREREQLYIKHLRVELPLLALQFKIRGQAHMDEQGYRYVCAVMTSEPGARRVDGMEIAIRPLAFVLDGGADDQGDTVANMYVIGPLGAPNQPCLLYRPLQAHPLLQYPSEVNLLYAIKHSWELRLSVLAWLPDRVRFNYSQYVFPQGLPSPWNLPQLLSDPALALMSVATVKLASTTVAEPALPTLFKANARAMVELADRQSVSNAEDRWATLQLNAWRIFSLVLPFLGRTAGITAWIWQIMDDLQEITEAESENGSQSRWAALTDLMLNLGMALAHRVATRAKHRIPVWKKPPAEPVTTISGQLKIERVPDVPTSTAPPRHELPLHTDGVVARSRLGLGALLDSLKVSQTHTLTLVTEPGPHRHLYFNGTTYYAKVGERWFEVRLTDNEDVQIINSSTQPVRTGPLLISNARGEWFVDVRLRLRGGGPKSRSKLLEQKKKAEIAQLTEQVNRFCQGSEAHFERLKGESSALADATADNFEAQRTTYLEHIDTRRDEYQATIDQLHSLNLKETVANYRNLQIGMLKAQLYLNQEWLDHMHPELVKSLQATMHHLEQETWPISAPILQVYQRMSEVMEGTIDRIKFAHTRFELLTRLGKSAAQLKLEYLQRLPKSDLNDLMQFQIELNARLCIKESSAELLGDAAFTVESVVEDANLTIQGILDLAAEDEQLALNERTEALNSMVDQLAAIDQRFKDFQEAFSEHLLEEPVQLMTKYLKAFEQNAQNNLASLLIEQKSLEPPQPKASGSSQPKRKRIIHTRFKGTLVGQPRTSGEDHFVEVVAPLTGKVTTFHEKTPGVWLERVTATPPVKPILTVSLHDSVTAGQALLDHLEAFIRDIEAKAAKPNRIPVEIEELYRQQGLRFRSAAEVLDRHLEQSTPAQRLKQQASDLSKQLNKGADRLYRYATQTPINMMKRQAPTAARIQWLDSKDEIYIVKLAEREQLKGHRKDFVQKYEIRDPKTQRLLWYAHFHYATKTGPARDFTVAHLKTLEQANLGGKFDMRAASSSGELIEIYRSTISRDQANSVFFT